MRNQQSGNTGNAKLIERRKSRSWTNRCRARRVSPLGARGSPHVVLCSRADDECAGLAGQQRVHGRAHVVDAAHGHRVELALRARHVGRGDTPFSHKLRMDTAPYA
eukprot:6177334-Pleurochrysis_carterae.AAC.5